MTRDDVLAMEPGRELDALVAKKVMGWFEVWKPFSPSTDISAAWEVVEKLQGTYWVRMNSMMKDHSCGVGKPDMRWEYYGNSMPEAICKAALLAVLEATP